SDRRPEISPILRRIVRQNASTRSVVCAGLGRGHLQADLGSRTIGRGRPLKNVDILLCPAHLRGSSSRIINLDAYLFGFCEEPAIDVVHVELAKPVKMPSGMARS